jgi:hypothetical protein
METSNKATEVSRFRQEWPVILLFFCLAASPSVIRHFFGRGWGAVAAVVVFAVWLVIRPWRFRFLPQDSKRGIFMMGTVMLGALVVVHCFFYWFVQSGAMPPNPY